jgi:vacuolar-type H+-ATPase subunit F/Vma7
MRVAVLGERVRVEGWTLAGALVRPAEDPLAVRDAWRRLPPDVAVAVLTPAAAQALRNQSTGAWPLTVVMPE